MRYRRDELPASWRLRVCMIALATFAGYSDVASAENWPAWRGPHGTGASNENGLPLFWGEDFGVAWKTTLRGSGNSTPVVWDDAVYVTSQDDERLLLSRLEARTGRIVWTRVVGKAKANYSTPDETSPDRGIQKFHRLHNMASPSPVTDGRYVIAHFGDGTLATYDQNGEQQWKRNLQDEQGPYTIWWGHANSPVLYSDLVISVCMQDSLADVRDTPVASYLIAHHLASGNEAWRTDRSTSARAEQCDAYTTPVLRRGGDRVELLVMGGNVLDAYDPTDGRRLWFLPGLLGGRTVTGPTYGEGLIFATLGMRGELIAMRTDGDGEQSPRTIRWRLDAGTPDSCSPVLWGDLLFVIADSGVARCLSARSGRVFWRRRLPGEYKASPIAAEGRIYFLNQEGLCTVVSASDRFGKLAENQIGEETIASPAASNGRIFLRGRQTLYAVAKP